MTAKTEHQSPVLNVVKLTQDLVAIESESRISNAAVSDYLEQVLRQVGFVVERLVYVDQAGVEKVNLIARKGEGTGGLGFFSHSDTVPGNPDGWQPFKPTINKGRLIGRGSCDMKGPLAATIVACAGIDPADLKQPLYLVISADEEVGYQGALNIVAESQTFKAGWPTFGVIAEPTQLTPVYAHKGRARVWVTAHGHAAHTSTDQGISANFLIAPFLAEMAELATRFRRDERFLNHTFTPPTNSFNMTLNDGNCASNITAPKTICTLDFRLMPDDHHAEALALIIERAERYNLEVTSTTFNPFSIDPEAEIIRAACQASGVAKAVTVPFGTEAAVYMAHLQGVVLGPGNIDQAHTVGEWISLAELSRAVEVYQRLIDDLLR